MGFSGMEKMNKNQKRMDQSKNPATYKDTAAGQFTHGDHKGELINCVLQNSSTLIGQLATFTTAGQCTSQGLYKDKNYFCFPIVSFR